MYKERRYIKIFPAATMFYLFGSFIYGFSIRYIWLAILIASLIFVFTFLYIDKKLIMIYFIFFLLAIFNNYLYYNLAITSNEKVRVEKVYYNIIEASIKGRKVLLKGEFKGLNKGELIFVKGKYTNKKQSDRGIVGEFEVDKYYVMDKDIIGEIYSIRNNIHNKLRENIGSRDSALVTAISMGESDGIDKEDHDVMKELGVLHVLSISGLHIYLVYSILKKIVGERLAIIPLGGYVIFTGIATSTVRAFIMIVMMVFAKVVKRGYNSVGAISIAAMLISLYRPYSIFQVGFCLSFLCTISIILFKERIEGKLKWIYRGIRSSVSITIASQILSLPYMIVVFEEFSINFILGNLILIPIMNIILVIGNILILTVNFQGIFDFLSFNIHYIIKLLDYVIELLEQIATPMINSNIYIVYMYAGIGITIWLYKRGYKKIIYLPIVIFLYSSISMYNIFPRFKYNRNGVLNIGYKGEWIGVKVKEVIDVSKVKRDTHMDFQCIRINKNIILIKEGNEYILDVDGSKYTLQFFYGKKDSMYAIINFNNGEFNEFIIVNNKIIVLD